MSTTPERELGFRDGVRSDESTDQRAVTIVLHRRPDGGLRVHSPDLPGLGLSGADPAQVLEDIGPAIRVLLEHQGLWPEYRAPTTPET